MQLSSDPILLKLQLKDILERSRKALAELTSPVIVVPDYDVSYNYGNNMSRFDYNPPSTRFVRSVLPTGMFRELMNYDG